MAIFNVPSSVSFRFPFRVFASRSSVSALSQRSRERSIRLFIQPFIACTFQSIRFDDGAGPRVGVSSAPPCPSESQLLCQPFSVI